MNRRSGSGCGHCHRRRRRRHYCYGHRRLRVAACGRLCVNVSLLPLTSRGRTSLCCARWMRIRGQRAESRANPVATARQGSSFALHKNRGLAAFRPPRSIRIDCRQGPYVPTGREASGSGADFQLFYIERLGRIAMAQRNIPAKSGVIFTICRPADAMMAVTSLSWPRPNSRKAVPDGPRSEAIRGARAR